MRRTISLLSSREAVMAAISECDALGRDKFLRKYGFKRSRIYQLLHAGKIYDSKAIAGVAFGLQYQEPPLRAREFSGGVATVVAALEAMDFAVVRGSHPALQLRRGQLYSRLELLERYGGQLRRGIWTPKEFPVVFLFTGGSGKTYGYEDRWSDGIFQYCGEGTSGDMTFTSGNAAIRDHRQIGKDLLLFEDAGKGRGVQYMGLFECASWTTRRGRDKLGNEREIIIFDLVPVSSAADPDGPGSTAPAPSTTDLAKLRKAAYAAIKKGGASRRTGDARRTWFERSEQVRRYVLARAQGSCEACLRPAPFCRPDGAPYLEPHHTMRLADEGPDDPAWVGAICPTCHRRIHSGADGTAYNEALKAALAKKEDLASR